MSKPLKLLLIALSTILMGCATSHIPSFKERFNQINIGMTKPQVLEVLGSPDSHSAQSDIEYLNYVLGKDNCRYNSDPLGLNAGIVCTQREEYFVRLLKGKVEPYGRLGDFDSTKTPEVKSIIDLNLKEKKQKD